MLILISLFISVLLESTLITLPLTLITVIFAAVTLRKNEVFILAFFSGLMLDILTLKSVGISSLFFTLVVFLIFLYQRKFEIGTFYFFATSTFLGSLLYLIATNVNMSLPQSIFMTAASGAAFSVFNILNKKALYS